MKVLGRVFICLFQLGFWGVLCSPDARNEGSSQPGLASEAEASEPLTTVFLAQAMRNGYALFPPLFRVLLSDYSSQRWEEGAPTPQPDSRALKYMKRLYKMFATKEGIPKASKNHLYNTVRLISPHVTKRQVRGDLHLVDLIFNLDYVTALEHLLKSVLLYSFDKSISKSSAITCACSLVVKEHESATQVCFGAPRAMAFNLHFGFRRKWVEIDVTAFLEPLIASNKRSIHMVVNFTCLKDDQFPNSDQDSFNMALVSPSLLLYLNDTSEQAYHRWNLLKHKRKNPVWSRPRNGPLASFTGETEQDNLRGKIASRHRRDGEGESANVSASIYTLSQYYKLFLFPQNECELHNFWLKFNQLKWDRWIIEPRRYNPRYCQGECPRALGHRYGSPVHAMVQNIIYEKLDSSVPRPSCVPAEYSPLSVLKVESDSSIVYKEYEDMMATKCTCR